MTNEPQLYKPNGTCKFWDQCHKYRRPGSHLCNVHAKQYQRFRYRVRSDQVPEGPFIPEPWNVWDEDIVGILMPSLGP